MLMPYLLSLSLENDWLPAPKITVYNGCGGDQGALEDFVFYDRGDFFEEEKDCVDGLWINGVMPRRNCMDKVGFFAGLI